MIIANTNFNLIRRVLATLVDYGLFYLILYTYLLFFGEQTADGAQEVTGLLTLPIFVIWYLYFVFLEGFYPSSATLGHQLFYLKVVKLNDREIDVKHSLKRHLLDPIDLFLFGIPAIIAIQSTEQNQRLGDLWAGTKVIRISDKKDSVTELNSLDKSAGNIG